jgi:antirestriction protein ArdC
MSATETTIIKSRGDVYARVANRIVADLEKRVRPWLQPERRASGGAYSRPPHDSGQGDDFLSGRA